MDSRVNRIGDLHSVVNRVVCHIAVPWNQLICHMPVQRVPSDHKMDDHHRHKVLNITVCHINMLPSNYSQLPHLPQFCMLHSKCGEVFPEYCRLVSVILLQDLHILCNDVAPKRVIVNFITGVWWIAGGLHLASYHNVSREQAHLSPHFNSTVLLTKVVKSEERI